MVKIVEDKMGLVIPFYFVTHKDNLIYDI